MYIFNTQSLLIKLWLTIDEETLEADNKRITLEEDHQQIMDQMVTILIMQEIGILIEMALYPIH